MKKGLSDWVGARSGCLAEDGEEIRLSGDWGEEKKEDGREGDFGGGEEWIAWISCVVLDGAGWC